MPSVTAREEVLSITRLGAQGDGVADTAHGTVHVPYALPGERVRVELSEDRGRLIEVLEASPSRVTPACRHFGQCGGCAMQHLEAARVADWKREQVKAAFAARGIDAPVAPVVEIGMGERRRLVLSAKRDAGGVALGFHTARGHEIVALEECPVARPELVAALGGLAHLVEPLLPRREEARVTVTLVSNGLDVAIEGIERQLSAALRATVAGAASALRLVRLAIGGDIVFATAEPILELGPARVVPPPGAFLQASAKAERAMTELVLGAVGGRKVKRVADLFCGLGTFTFPIGRTANVLAVDSDRRVVTALADAARRTPGIKPVETRVRDLLREPLSAKELESFGAVVLDPPRAGAKAQAEMIAKSKVPIVIAVSCNPATLARDARILIDGGYGLAAVTPIDQFVQSAHVEAVAVLSR